MLPAGAMFCGECGRAVGDVARVATAPSAAPPAPAAPPRAPRAAKTLHCEACGAGMDADDIFCGECGHVARSISEAFAPASRDTARITLPGALVRPAAEAVAAEALIKEPVVEPPVAAPPIGEPPVIAVAPAIESDDVESTRIVSRRPGVLGGERFVLQFSTGENVTVGGSGLLGRNPQPQPGERVDHLVSILDPGKTVSKTHLEFGQDGGQFWVNDRFSGNGSVLRQPDAEPRRCEPGKRYRVARGSRIDIGEQFFVVS